MKTNLSGLAKIHSFRVIAVLMLAVLAAFLIAFMMLSDSADAKKKKAKFKTVTQTFTSSGAITIPAGAPTTKSGPAGPYPSAINVSKFVGGVQDVNVKLNGLSHTFPNDIDMLLVHNGQNAIIMSDTCGVGPGITGANLSLDDQAASPLPATNSGCQAGGTFQPTNLGAGDTFPPPAPSPSGNVLLSTFNGLSPNGTWQLFINDDSSADVGSLNSWAVQITGKVKVKKHRHKHHGHHH